jgi:2,3-diketo-5-methylthio-1-phosphopentane phosphatase
MPDAFLCDFDGTVSPEDIGAALVRTFSRGRDAERCELLERWTRESIGHREMIEAECRLLVAGENEALEFSRRFALDPAFAPFVRERRANGDAVTVVSEGFDLYVRDQLTRAGLGDVPWSANRLRFEGDRVHPEFPFADPTCRSCGNCKARHVREWRAKGYRTVLVGDGLSDRCGARAADTVVARRELLEWCRRVRLPARGFETFADVAAAARRGAAFPALA